MYLSSSGSVVTSAGDDGLSSDTLERSLLDSPHRLEPPCMLGMLRMAMPSKEMLLRSRVTPSHLREDDQSRKIKKEKKGGK